MTDDNGDGVSVVDFFDNRHAIGLIALIDRAEGDIAVELDRKADLTGKPARDLRNEAIEVGLLEEAPYRSKDHPRSIRYQLTPMGKTIQALLRGMGLDQVQREYLKREQELENAVRDVQELLTHGDKQRAIKAKKFVLPGTDVEEMNAWVEELEGEYEEDN